MKKIYLLSFVLLTPFLLLTAGPKSSLKSPPDFTLGGKIPEKATHDWNLGPTGARGWIYSNKMDTTEARQIYITKIDSKSPSDKILKVGDVILGVFKQKFSYDPRTEFGKAITQAEAKDGKLSLIIWRDGKVSDKVLKLKVMGSYSDTAPFQCKKSKLILQQGLNALSEKMQKNPEAGNLIPRSYNALALLASGESRYLSQVRSQCKSLGKYSDPKQSDLHSWYYGPINLLLAEYTLAKKSRIYMKDMERITMAIVRGQSEAGSWGHKFVGPNGRLKGYGMMNAPGLPLATSLILARKAGVKSSELDNAIKKTSQLTRFYVGKGSVPYGDHDPWIETHEDNGKNGISAIMFNLLGDVKATNFFSKMSVSSHGAERDMGHTGNFFNVLWSVPGVALSGPKATGSWMKEFGWYFDLARRWDGTFAHLGPPQDAPDSYNSWDATGAYLLAYAQPLKKIYLTGKKSNLLKPLSQTEADKLVADSRGWLLRNKHSSYKERNDSEVLEGLKSWSPTIRDRCARELGKRKKIDSNKLVEMLKSDDIDSQLGACEALKYVRIKNKDLVVKELEQNLDSNDLWVRIKSAQALGRIGNPSKKLVDKLLTRIINTDTKSDPRAMESRYLCFLLFRRGGMVSKNVKNIDRKLLLKAIQAGLLNENGQSRGTISSIYKILSFDELKPLLPAIQKAIIEPAPSGVMFSAQVRMEGLKFFANNKVSDGIDMLVDYTKTQNQWGSQARVKEIMAMLEKYGVHAKPAIPKLKEFTEWCKTEEGFPEWARTEKRQVVEAAIKRINASQNNPELINLKDLEK